MKNIHKILITTVILLGGKKTETAQASIMQGTHNWNADIEYYAVYSADGLNKPLIILEGFDIMDDYTLSMLYENWDRGDFISEARDNGYDIFCVNFRNNSQDLHLNAQSVENFIKDINTYKSGNQEGILAGESMGGVIARMALKELEDEPYDHEIGLYISFDAPHRGANIPISFQTALETTNDLQILNIGPFQWFLIFGFLKPNIDVDDLELLENKLKSIAGQQLLITHVSGNTEFNELQSELDNLGYPAETRNIAIANGSNIADKLFDYEPGESVLYHSNQANCYFMNRVVIQLNFTELNSHQRVSEIISQVPPCITVDGESRYWDTGPQCYDICPAGYFDISDYNIYGAVDEFSFLPTVSAIDLLPSLINGSNGLYYFDNTPGSGRTKDDLIDNGYSPFDDIYSNVLNSHHITLNSSLISQVKERELMFDDFRLQNREIKYDRSFIYDNKITVGSNVNVWPDKNWEEGEVIFKSGTTVDLIADEITFDAGTTIEIGCILTAENP